MNKYQEDLKFDRTTECDWCDEVKKVSICHYGTTHYNRLICKECAKKVNNWENTCISSSNYKEPGKPGDINFMENRLQDNVCTKR